MKASSLRVEPRFGLKEEDYKYYHYMNVRDKELDVETFTMMMKYQVIYIQMETAISLIAKIRRSKQLQVLYRAFKKYKEKTVEKKSDQEMVKQIRGAIKYLIRIQRKKYRNVLYRALNEWRRIASVIKFHTKRKKIEKNLEDKYNSRILQKTQEAQALESKLKAKSSELSIIKDCGEKLRQTIKEREAREKALMKVMDKAKQTDTEDNKESLEVILPKLETKVKVLEKENLKLKEQINHTEGSVTDFANEMNKYLDSIEFLRILFKEICSVGIRE